ncbi:conjugal transfer protein TraB [Streptomyces sp. SID8385]|uniref:conjugal transfer protein TraB n=1 Tax=Streptomyces sp. SID8385 TaxID=2690364 RepID=UPI001360DE65|nr:conjugal transfer protein TraB [Streptomyces sp. SID8385]
MSELMPRPTPAPVPAPAPVRVPAPAPARRVKPLKGAGGGGGRRVWDDNRYAAVQQRLKDLAATMDAVSASLLHSAKRMKQNGEEAASTADAIARADLDGAFVELTEETSSALATAHKAMKKTARSSQSLAVKAHQAQTLHQRMYQPLDEVRSGRRHRTPKPGFFSR